mgnify:CR=1 FL=1|jgi:hypothetical protein
MPGERRYEQACQDRSRTHRHGAGGVEGHADGPDNLVISIVRDSDSWEFRADADQATRDRPGFPESVAMLVQIGDHLSKQYDVKG